RDYLLQSFLHGFFLTISGRGTIHRALLSVGLYFMSVLRLLLRLFLTSLLCHRFSSSFHSPAAVAFCALSFSPSGIPSLFAAVSSFRPAVVIRCLSSSVLITPEVFTPRISEISGEVTGCL